MPRRRFVQFGPPSDSPPQPTPVEKKPKPTKKPRQKHDPQLLAKARELRDRYLEHINGDPSRMLSGGAAGKYDVSRRALGAGESSPVRQLPGAGVDELSRVA